MEPQAKRFAGVCDSDVNQVIAGRVPQATKEATSGWLRVFHQFADKLRGVWVVCNTISIRYGMFARAAVHFTDRKPSPRAAGLEGWAFGQ